MSGETQRHKSLDEIRRELCAPFRPDEVSWRVQRAYFSKSKQAEKGQIARGLVLVYVEARDVMNRLDDALGVGNWSREHRVQEIGGKAVYICKISASFDSENWDRMYEDVAEATDIEAVKGGASDSFKRAAVNLGINRCAYYLGDTEADLCWNGFTWQITKDELERLALVYQKFIQSLDEYGRPKQIVVEPDPPPKKEHILFDGDETKVPDTPAKAKPGPKPKHLNIMVPDDEFVVKNANTASVLVSGDVIVFNPPSLEARTKAFADLVQRYTMQKATERVEKINELLGPWSKLDSLGQSKYILMLTQS